MSVKSAYGTSHLISGVLFSLTVTIYNILEVEMCMTLPLNSRLWVNVQCKHAKPKNTHIYIYITYYIYIYNTYIYNTYIIYL